MKKFLALSLIGSSLFIGSNSAKADWDYWVTKEINTGDLNDYGTYFYKYNSSNQELELILKHCNNLQEAGGSYICNNGSNHYVDNKTGKLIVETESGEFKTLNENSGTFTAGAAAHWSSSYTKTYARPSTRIDAQGNKIVELGGSKLIEKKNNGELHIGENSWITKEENGRQKVYAKDANGNPIPIDYTNGTKLLINGRDVEQSINNVGALSAALTGLPTVPSDTTLACGLGTGTHGGDFAFSGGCASKVNNKLSINYAASITMPGQDYAGDFEDTFSARAGFVWKLGKSIKPTQISMKAKEKMEAKIFSLEKKNKKILSKNQKLENKLSTLMARLEKIEKIALGEIKSKDLAVYSLK